MHPQRNNIYQIFIRQGEKLTLIFLAAMLLTVGCSNLPANIPSNSATSSPTTSPGQQNYSLSVSINPPGSGTISVVPPGDSFAPGIKVTIIATALEGYKFDHWGGDASDTSSTVVISMDSSKEIDAYFESTEPIISAPRVSPAAAKSILDTDPTAVFVDVRPKADYDKNHIPGAISIPFEEIETRYTELGANTQLIIYSECA